MCVVRFSCCSLIQKRADSSLGGSASQTGSVSTVYSFLGASGSDTSLLQMPTSAISLTSATMSGTVDESSALSQFLNGAGTATMTSAAVTGGSRAPPSNSSDEASSASVSSSSMASVTLSAGANSLGLPLVAGGVLAGLLALI